MKKQLKRQMNPVFSDAPRLDTLPSAAKTGSGKVACRNPQAIMRQGLAFNPFEFYRKGFSTPGVRVIREDECGQGQSVVFQEV